MWSDTSWTPPEKFGCVERGLYRSAFPTTASHEYLQLLGLRTVVNLSQELPMRAVISGFEDLGAELINLGLRCGRALTSRRSRTSSSRRHSSSSSTSNASRYS